SSGVYALSLHDALPILRSLRCYHQNRLAFEEISGKETPEDVIHGFYGEVVELVEAMNQGRRPRPSIEDVYPSVELCFRLADSVRSEEHTSELQSRGQLV